MSYPRLEPFVLAVDIPICSQESLHLRLLADAWLRLAICTGPSFLLEASLASGTGPTACLLHACLHLLLELPSPSYCLFHGKCPRLDPSVVFRLVLLGGHKLKLVRSSWAPDLCLPSVSTSLEAYPCYIALQRCHALLTFRCTGQGAGRLFIGLCLFRQGVQFQHCLALFDRNCHGRHPVQGEIRCGSVGGLTAFSLMAPGSLCLQS
mmetsp:Transcript_48087/g.114286  ORF Transcript_48087/g.114286 Transcript_48087/m.114286 type:complete len:207 (+) Transcript_48087:330-950(+)